MIRFAVVLCADRTSSGPDGSAIQAGRNLDIGKHGNEVPLAFA